MKNATIADIEEFRKTGVLREDVMYNWDCGIEYPFKYNFPFHGKRLHRNENLLRELMDEKHLALAESTEGDVFLIRQDFVRPNTNPDKGPAQQPKKPKRKPVKGTKPETIVPMSEDIKLKVGDTVILRGGIRTKIRTVDGSTKPYQIEYDGKWCCSCGENVDAAEGFSEYAAYDIVGVVKQTKSAQVQVENEWKVWFGGDMPVAADTKVEVVFRDGERVGGYARTFRWYHAEVEGKGCPSVDIIAYREVK